MTKMAYIYGLADPRDSKIHYIGHTLSMSDRYQGHLSDKADTPKTRWMAEMIAEDAKPLMIELAQVPYFNRYEQEYKWIHLGKAMGWPLTNTVAMKTNKYTSLYDGLGKTLVVEVDKGLTWKSLKQHAKDDRLWSIHMLNCSLFASCGFTIALSMFGAAINDEFLFLVNVAVWVAFLSLGVLIFAAIAQATRNVVIHGLMGAMSNLVRFLQHKPKKEFVS